MSAKTMHTLAGLLAGCLLALPVLLMPAGCANIIPPAGGPRDSLPPVLVKASPADSLKNFKANRITLSFDEYVDIQNLQDNLIVSPVPKTQPAVDHKLNTITIRLRDSLEPNTTYTLNFGQAIKDINEGNVLKNFTYMFSTGARFDSLQLRGRVILAQTGEADSTLLVLLHRRGDDSAIIKEKPRYVARLDNQGNFLFRNLPADTFYLYALKDESGSYRFSGRDQLFAFADKALKVDGTDTSTHLLYAFADNEGVSPAGPRAAKPAVPPKEKRLVIKTNLDGNRQDLLGNLVLSVEQPLRGLDSSRIHFSSDSSFQPVSGYRWIRDSTSTQLTLLYPWKENTLYNLVIDKDFAEDTLGRKLLKADTIRFTTKQRADYGLVRITFRNLDLASHPVLQFIQHNNVVDSFALAGNSFSRELFPPGDYELRILFDRNQNGRWDPGHFFGRREQPELARPVPNGRINIKPNWENEFEREAPPPAP